MIVSVHLYRSGVECIDRESTLVDILVARERFEVNDTHRGGSTESEHIVASHYTGDRVEESC